MNEVKQTMTELADELKREADEIGYGRARLLVLKAVTALRSAAAPQGVKEALETARYVFEEFMPSGPLVNDALKKIKAALSAAPAEGREDEIRHLRIENARLRDEAFLLIEQCAKCVPIKWDDPLLVNIDDDLPSTVFDELLRGIAKRIRALASKSKV